MTDENLKIALNNLYLYLKEDKTNTKEILAKAVSLGMKYQEERIKAGIDIVFENLKLCD